MASVTEQLGARLRLPELPLRFLAVVALAPIALGISRALPAEGAGLGLRLAAAGACVLLLPGALLLRALDWPSRLGIALAGSVAWSLAAVFVGLTLTFGAAGSLTLTIAVVGVVSAGALVGIMWAPASRLRRDDLMPVVLLAVGGLALGAVAWWASTRVGGDALFHLARVRKLDEFPVLSSVQSLNEFRNGSLHPGYAFPLWHGVLALVARLAAVDPTLVVLHFSTLLAPLALVLAYAAGAALFASRAGGVATAGAQAALLGFQRDGVGSFELAALPSSAARLLLVPAVLALAFAYVRGGGGRMRLVTLALAALALAVVHPTYAVFVALPLAGFLAVRPVLDPERRGEWRRTAGTLVALLVPTALFFAWLFPAVSSAQSVLPGAAERSRALAAYGGALDELGRWFSLSPEVIARGGAATVAALLAVPAAALAGRRRWAGWVLGGSLAVLLVLLVPPFFTWLSELASLSQARRLALFVPLAFALAGAATLAGRFRWWGCAGALALGVVLQLVFPGGAGGRLGELGPAWVTWFAAGGAAIGLVAAALRRPTWARPDVFAVAAIALFSLPVAIGGFRDTAQDPPDRQALTPGLVEALRTEVPRRTTVFSNLETSYRIGAYAPVYVAAAPPAHVANTEANKPLERRRDVIDFFFEDDVSYLDKFGILKKYGASWVVVDKTRKVPQVVEFLPPPVYEDERYALYRLRRD